MIVSSLGLLVYTEVIKYQMRKQAAGDNSNSFKGVVKKTGIFTFFGFTMTLVNLILNTLFPDKSKNQNYFLSQDLFSCCVIGVILPLIIAKTNDSMSKLFELRLTFNDAEERWCLNNFISKIFSRNKNMIHPIV
jgi:hypothetical protein